MKPESMQADLVAALQDQGLRITKARKALTLRLKVVAELLPLKRSAKAFPKSDVHCISHVLKFWSKRNHMPG
ncbi:MAG: hypothetical protein CM1200mP39_23430 [Dehalococcoidia bacterium]|nr:MAG: hypothetical protein CM1200mP39_23430 [Dehalococcoidia bacterium]